MKKVLLTGASGFLGQALMKELLMHNFKVSALVRTTTNKECFKDLIDISCLYNIDSSSISDILAKVNPNVVIHCAVLYGRRESIIEVFKFNVDFYMDLIHASIKHGVEHFVNTDTFSGKKVDYQYLKAYHTSKRNVLEWSKLLLEQSSMKFSNLRLEHIYGPNDNMDKFIPSMMRSMRSNIPFLDLTEGLQKRDFIYINDVVLAYVTVILEQKVSLMEYEVGTGKSTSIKEFLLRVKSQLPKCTTLLNFGVLETRKGELEESVANINELKRLGWSPQVSLDEGLTLTMNSLNS